MTPTLIAWAVLGHTNHYLLAGTTALACALWWVLRLLHNTSRDLAAAERSARAESAAAHVHHASVAALNRENRRLRAQVAGLEGRRDELAGLLHKATIQVARLEREKHGFWLDLDVQDIERSGGGTP